MEALYNVPTYTGTFEKTWLQANHYAWVFQMAQKMEVIFVPIGRYFQAKENLTRITRDEGFTAVFFDGRGGPPARGGGNTHDFYASLGDTIEDKEVQITIQGQTISSNFGKPVSCAYNLEQLLSAGVENAVFHNQ